MTVCADLRLPVVPRGAGTGLSGGVNAIDGCLVLDLTAMNAVVEVDPDNLTCVVQPGGLSHSRSGPGHRRTLRAWGEDRDSPA